MHRLRLFAAHAIEAGWLAVVLVTPLFLDKTGAQVFEPAKVGLLRALALFVALAWLLKGLCSPVGGANKAAGAASVAAFSLRSAPGTLWLAVGLLVLSTLLASALSLAPYESFWGHRENAQGALTLLAQGVIFAALAFNLRHEAQLRRLLTACILPSVPIAVYAICQRFGLEPLHVTMRETELQRVTSLLGQPVFLSAYLGMVMPFCALRVVEALRAREQPASRRWLSFGAYLTLLSLQALAALWTESRGPVLAIVGAFALGALALAAERRARRVVLGLCGAALCAGLVFALWGAGRRGAEEVAPQSGMVKRASETFAVSGGGGQFRVTSWQVAQRVFTNTQPLELGDGERDARSSLRKLIGYGPELQYAISPAFYDAELTRLFGYFLTSHYHNDAWDVLISCGLLGLFAWLALQASVLWLLVREIVSDVPARWFWSALTGGALVGGAIAASVRGASFTLLGLILGALAGLALFLGGTAFTRANEGEAREWAPLIGVRCAALTAIAAHLIETSFSFTVAATGALFWICCALALASLRITRRAEDADTIAASTSLEDGALLGLALATLGFAFLGATPGASRPGEIIWQGLTVLSQPADAHIPVVLIISVTTLLSGALLLSLEAVRAEPALTLASRVVRTAAVAAGIALVYWLRLAFILAELARPGVERALLVATQLELRSATTRSLFLAVLALLMLFAVSRAARSAPNHTAKGLAFWRAPAAIVCGLFAALLVPLFALTPASAESAVALGDSLRAQGELALAEQAYQQASALRPRVDAYDAMLGKLYNARARIEAAHAAAWLERADQAFAEALQKNPAAGEHAVNLALLRGQRALKAPTIARAGLTTKVVELYQRALRLNPQDPTLLRSWAATQANLLNDLQGALASAQRLVSLEPRAAASVSLLADIQLKRASAQAGEARRATYLEAAKEYEKARALAPAEPSYRVNEGKAYLAAGERDKAIASWREALRVLPAESRGGQAVAVLIQRAQASEAQ